MSDLPTLNTERLTLDTLTERDIPRLVELCGDWKIAQTTLRIPHPYTEQDAREWLAFLDRRIAEGQAYSFAVRLTETGELIGNIRINPDEEHRRAELGYWVGVPYWGMGYCTEAGREIIRYGFEDLQLNAITCGYCVGNTASQRVMDKLGIPLEGVRKQHYFRHGKYIDLAVGTLLHSEWSQTLTASP